MASLSQFKGALSCVVGSACAIGTPTAVYLSRQSDKTEKVSRGGALTKVELDNSLQFRSPSGDLSSHIVQSGVVEVGKLQEQPAISENSKFNEQFEAFGGELDKNYKQAQKKNNQTSNVFNWKAELKKIFALEQESNSDGVISKSENQDCSQITGGKTDYCVYLEFSKGGFSYRLKVDRYGNGQAKAGDVIVLKSNGSQTKWYSSKKNEGETALSNKSLDSFQGKDKMANNGGGKLDGVSIEVNRTA